MNGDELMGLVNGVKGKLFELELVEHLNSGYLPDGVQAELAESVTQPGFDVRILDEQGNVVEVLQAKATESAAYVKEALERYPDIDVMTTSEVHGQLVAMGAADQVSDSGISEAALQSKIEAAASAGGGSGGFDGSDLLPTGVGLAIIALSVFTTKGATAELMGEEFGERTARAGLGTLAGKVPHVIEPSHGHHDRGLVDPGFVHLLVLLDVSHHCCDGFRAGQYRPDLGHHRRLDL